MNQKYLLIPVFCGLLTLNGCSHVSSSVSYAMATAFNSDFRDFHQLFEDNVTGKSFDDMKKIFWSYENQYSSPENTVGNIEHWLLSDKCSYYAEIRDGKVVGVNQNFISFGAGHKKQVQETSRCYIPTARLQQYARLGSIRSNFEFMGLKFDHDKIKDFKSKYPACKLKSTKIQKNFYVSNSETCFGKPYEYVEIGLNPDATIGSLAIRLMGPISLDAGHAFENALIKKHGTPDVKYPNGSGWMLQGVEFSLIGKEFYHSQEIQFKREMEDMNRRTALAKEAYRRGYLPVIPQPDFSRERALAAQYDRDATILNSIRVTSFIYDNFEKLAEYKHNMKEQESVQRNNLNRARIIDEQKKTYKELFN